MPQLPPELWENVLNKLELVDDRAALMNCALVCKIFLAATRPRIFSTFYIQEDSEAPRRCREASQLLTNSPYLVPYFRTFSISFARNVYTDQPEPTVNLATEPSLPDLLGMFTHVEFLILDSDGRDWGEIPARFRSALMYIASLPTIQRVGLYGRLYRDHIEESYALLHSFKAVIELRMDIALVHESEALFHVGTDSSPIAFRHVELDSLKFLDLSGVTIDPDDREQRIDPLIHCPNVLEILWGAPIWLFDSFVRQCTMAKFTTLGFRVDCLTGLPKDDDLVDFTACPMVQNLGVNISLCSHDWENYAMSLRWTSNFLSQLSKDSAVQCIKLDFAVSGDWVDQNSSTDIWEDLGAHLTTLAVEGRLRHLQIRLLVSLKDAEAMRAILPVAVPLVQAAEDHFQRFRAVHGCTFEANAYIRRAS
ncbi:hypothetical protein HGRIS_004091 [Hohenbuehelia grisea]|uniref:F-box domain-containing protein n=1 Tax=Hohenbuehelia grisea TaxID=104357 RepID=A0ABR3JHF2_9AGAR